MGCDGGRDIGPSAVLVGGGRSAHSLSVLNRRGSNSFDIDHNGPQFSRNDTAAGEEQYDEESQISSSYPLAMGEGEYDEELQISMSEIVVAISECRNNLAIDLNRQPTLIKTLQGRDGSYLIRGRSNPSQEISQGNARMEMNDPYTLNVEDDEKNMLAVPTQGATMIQKKNSDSQELGHCLQMLEMSANWSFAAMIAIICANLNGSSANNKRAAMTVGGFGYAGVLFLSLLFMASRLFQSALPPLEARLKFIVGLVILLFCLVTVSLLAVLST